MSACVRILQTVLPSDGSTNKGSTSGPVCSISTSVLLLTLFQFSYMEHVGFCELPEVIIDYFRLLHELVLYNVRGLTEIDVK